MGLRSHELRVCPDVMVTQFAECVVRRLTSVPRSGWTAALLLTRDLRPAFKKNSPQTLQPAGCPVDWLGLTEAVTLVAPRSFRYPAQRVTGGSAHTHGLFAREVSAFPDRGSTETPHRIRATALSLSHLTWSGTTMTI